MWYFGSAAAAPKNRSAAGCQPVPAAGLRGLIYILHCILDLGAKHRIGMSRIKSRLKLKVMLDYFQII